MQASCAGRSRTSARMNMPCWHRPTNPGVGPRRRSDLFASEVAQDAWQQRLPAGRLSQRIAKDCLVQCFFISGTVRGRRSRFAKRFKHAFRRPAARDEPVQSTRQPSDAGCHRSHSLKDDGHANPRRNRYWPSCCGTLTFGLATMNAAIGGQHRPVALGANGDSSGHRRRLVPLCRYLVA